MYPNGNTHSIATNSHLAAEEGHVTVCHLLVDRGANVGAINKEGQTPADPAMDKSLKSYLATASE
jgi:ankyrin repeat protein